MAEPDDELVTIWHPQVQVPASVTLGAYEALWGARGWLLQSTGARRASEILGRPIRDAEGLTVDELRQVLDGAGVQRGSSTTKDELLALLDPKSHPAPQAGPDYPTADKPATGTTPRSATKTTPGKGR